MEQTLEMETTVEIMNEHIGKMHGWCTPEKAKDLHDIIIKSNSQLSIELGVFGGRSLIPMAMAHRAKQYGFVLGVDPWRADAALDGVNDEANAKWWQTVDLKKIYQSCVDHINHFDLWSWCDTLRMKSETVGVLFPNGSIDVLHQDSNHSEKITCIEVEIYEPKMRPGGFWVSDDTTWATTQKSLGMLVERGFVLYKAGDNYNIYQKK